MGSLFVVHRPRRWGTTNKEAREVKGPRHGCSAVAQHKAESAGLSGVPACTSAFPQIIKELSYCILLGYLDHRVIGLALSVGRLARFEVRLHLHCGSSLVNRGISSHPTTLLHHTTATYPIALAHSDS
jgi:hypothetical protein